jgi:topoisomerase-4 subunit B
VYENEELNLLQHALNIEEGIENLRYNRVVVATDADVDGMHIRLLLLTFFLQFFPDLVRNGHVFISKRRCSACATRRRPSTATTSKTSRRR